MRKIKTLLFASVSWLSVQSALADDVFIALPGQNTGATDAIASSVTRAQDALMPQDSLTLLNGENAQIIVSFEVPDKGRFKLKKFKDQAFGAEKRVIDDYLDHLTKSPNITPAELRTNLPDLFSAIGDIRDGQESTAHVLIIGSPLHVDEHDPAISMLDAEGNVRVPSSGYLLGSLQLSSYGLGPQTKALENVHIHFCPILPDLTQHEISELGQVWGHYVGLRGGKLITFNADPASCIKRFEQRLNTPLALKPLDRNAVPAMVQSVRSGHVPVVTLNERENLREQLARERLTNQARVAELEGKLTQTDTQRQDAEKKTKQSQQNLAACERDLNAAQNESSKIQKIVDAGNKLEGVKSFSIFQEIRHPDFDNRTVMTGISYKLKNYPAYRSSWCYVNSINANGSSLRVEIGDKFPGRSISWGKVDLKILQDANISKVAFLDYRASCRFPEDR